MVAPVGYYWDERLCERETGYSCPENPERCRVLAPERVWAGAEAPAESCTFQPRPREILTAVHDPAYLRKVEEAHRRGMRFLDAGDTVVTPDVFQQGLLAASAGCAAVDAVLAGRFRSAFCAIRPPGHHANRIRGFGYCVFNNVAVAACYAQLSHGIGRVLIVDWDVHPGNGSQEIFWEEPAVFTLSFHQEGLFADSGREELEGEGRGRGFNRNVILPRFTPPQDYLAAFTGTVAAVAERFRPELLLISAGFDAHRLDPAAEMLLEAEDFAELTRIALEATRPFTGGRTVSLLEGGYMPNALRESVAAHVGALAADSA